MHTHAALHWLPSPQKRMNLTKTVTKVPITIDLEHVGHATEVPSIHRPAPKYDDEGWVSATRAVTTA